MTGLVWSALLVMTLLGSLASWMLKLASADLRPTHLIRDWHLYAGGAGYLCAALINIWVLRYMDLSAVLPLTALTYVWTLILARLFLGERLNRWKIGGVTAILLGVALIATM
ncbi:MAG: DMT family transporter [Acidipropionibacterium sp.]|jgi:drug/metabolite transporter (DMT)-like permease|nr:DMT family transporter [Acidipropionibacterium sp.]